MNKELICDGCGQRASPEHVARRLQRLEWSTRFRPVHIGTLLLGAAARRADAEFLYCPNGEPEGEARILLDVARISSQGKSREAVLAEFQRGGFFLTHVLECPLEDEAREHAGEVLAKHLPAALARIRRSLRPKRLAPISGMLADAIPALLGGNLGCVILLDQGQPFALEQDAAQIARLRELLASPEAARMGAS